MLQEVRRGRTKKRKWNYTRVLSYTSVQKRMNEIFLLINCMHRVGQPSGDSKFSPKLIFEIKFNDFKRLCLPLNFNELRRHRVIANKYKDTRFNVITINVCRLPVVKMDGPHNAVVSN